MDSSLPHKIGTLLARALLAAIFIWSGYHKIFTFDGTSASMAVHGMPTFDLLLGLAPVALPVHWVLLAATIVVELGGGLMLLVGWQARWAALAIFLFIIPATLIFHAFWAAPPNQQRVQEIQFFKNLAIMGGMLMVVIHGSGPWSLKPTR